MTASVSIYDAPAIDALGKATAVDRHRIKRLRAMFFKRYAGAEAALAELPTEARERFAAEVDFHPLELVEKAESAHDGATKLVFRTRAGQLIESVILRIATGRITLCVSSQVGCAARCRFCATGQMPIAQNLSTAEILDQIAQAGEMTRAEGRRLRNIVFMGMGEPFHNEASLYGALDALLASEAFNYSGRRLIVSTVGLPAAIVRCARRYPTVHLALSLHSAREDVRRSIIPIAQRHSLAELRSALDEAAAIQGQPIFIEYLLLRDVNDQEQDAQALVDYLAGLPTHVNLIPYNPIALAPELAGTERAGREWFAARLKQAGLRVTTRYSLGSDIAAACGQLVQEVSRRRPAGQTR